MIRTILNLVYECFSFNSPNIHTTHYDDDYNYERCSVNRKYHRYYEEHCIYCDMSH